MKEGGARFRELFVVGSFALMSFLSRSAAATYSLLAADVEKREVGVAIASCVGRGFDLGEVALLDETLGGVVAQSYFYAPGRDELMRQLSLGATPEGALDAVASEAFDPVGVERGYSFRQYAVVDFAHPQGAFTGAENLAEAGHRLFKSGSWRASAQGNSLSALVVLERLEAGFVTTSGDLAARLLGALERVEGGDAGDRRCAPALADSYFVRVQGDRSWEERLVSSEKKVVVAWLARVRAEHSEENVETSAPEKSPAGGCSYAPSTPSFGSRVFGASVLLTLGGYLVVRRRGLISCSRG